MIEQADTDLPALERGLTITSPEKLHWWVAIVCVLLLGIGIMRLVFGSGEFEAGDDGLVFGALIVALLYFGFRALNPTKKLQFTSTGVWTQAAGQQPWEMVDEMLIETRSGYKGIKERCLLLHWNEAVDLPAHELAEIHKFSDLGISEQDFTAVMGPVLQAFREAAG